VVKGGVIRARLDHAPAFPSFLREFRGRNRGHSPVPAYVPRDEYSREFQLTLDLRCVF